MCAVCVINALLAMCVRARRYQSLCAIAMPMRILTMRNRQHAGRGQGAAVGRHSRRP
jgi:hypothetical protein